VWLVPSIIGDAVTVSVVGILLGPFYPIAMNHAGRVLPRWLLTGSIGWIAGFGQVVVLFESTATKSLINFPLRREVLFFLLLQVHLRQNLASGLCSRCE
jgi:hypothetical protein